MGRREMVQPPRRPFRASLSPTHARGRGSFRVALALSSASLARAVPRSAASSERDGWQAAGAPVSSRAGPRARVAAQCPSEAPSGLGAGAAKGALAD